MQFGIGYFHLNFPHILAIHLYKFYQKQIQN